MAIDTLVQRGTLDVGQALYESVEVLEALAADPAKASKKAKAKEAAAGSSAGAGWGWGRRGRWQCVWHDGGARLVQVARTAGGCVACVQLHACTLRLSCRWCFC
jgi:hypothetical protein